MTNLARTLRSTLLALALVGLLGTGVAWNATDATTMAGSSGKPGEIDVGSTPTTLQFAGSSGKPGEPDVGSTPTTLQFAGSSGKPGEPDVG